MAEKKSFIMYYDYAEYIELLSDEECGRLFKAILHYAVNKTETELTGAVKMAFTVIKTQLDRDSDKYDKVIEQRRIAGQKSGKARKQKAEQNRTKRTNVNFVEQKGTKRTDNVNVNDNVNDNDIIKGDNIKKDKPSAAHTKKFTPPTVEEVQAYCKERKNGIDAEYFINYYSSNGWMRGKTKIQDWKACIRTWEKNEQKDNNKPQNKQTTKFSNFQQQETSSSEFDEMRRRNLEKLLNRQ